MGRLEGKITIVTGAADGIGLAISEAFATEGANVIMCDVNFEKCNMETDRLLKKGLSVFPLFCDVGNADSVYEMVNICVNKFGKIDVLVNNAAIAIAGNITEMTEDEWDKLMNVNLKGVFRCIKACLPFMISNKRGSVINLASTQAHRSWDDWTAYATAKGGILSMTKQLAGQFGKNNIRFNSISPGTILTPMAQERILNEGNSFSKASENQSAMQRFGEPEEVAMAAVFLASDESRFITGDDIKVDGGLCTLPRYFL
jgi:NAD(P)-dependent dehydrogenase (short-subunit alcohol dehydrogenase family)